MQSSDKFGSEVIKNPEIVIGLVGPIGVQLDLQEVQGAQQAVADAEAAKRQATAQGVQGLISLGSQAVVATTATTSVDFADVTWSSATFTAAFAAIYNDDQGDKLCVVLDFGGSKTATNGDFTISFPDPSTASNAIISLTS